MKQSKAQQGIGFSSLTAGNGKMPMTYGIGACLFTATNYYCYTAVTTHKFLIDKPFERNNLSI